MALACSNTPCFTLWLLYHCSIPALKELKQLSWRTPFFRVGNGSAFAVCTCLVRQSPCPWRQSAGSIASQIINSNNLRIEVPRSFLPQPTGNPHISSVITIYSFAPQQHPADSVMSLNPAMIGTVQKTLRPHSPSLTELMLSDMKGKRS